MKSFIALLCGIPGTQEVVHKQTFTKEEININKNTLK